MIENREKSCKFASDFAKYNKFKYSISINHAYLLI